MSRGSPIVHRAAHELVVMLRARFAPPAWALFEQVSNGTGVHADRHADAVAMSIWPSRGLELHGFEIKCNRHDFVRELKQPEKSGPVQDHCDRWWIVAGDDSIVQDGELPPTWGLLVASSGGKKLICKREAPALKPKPVSRLFLAAILRRAHDSEATLMRAEFERGHAKGVAEAPAEKQQQRVTADYDHEQLKKAVADFEAASGVKIENWCGERIGEAVKLVMSDYYRTPRKLEQLRESAKLALKGIENDLRIARELAGETGEAEMKSRRTA